MGPNDSTSADDANPSMDGGIITTTLALQLASEPSEISQFVYIPTSIAAVVIVVAVIVGAGVGMYWCRKKKQTAKSERFEHEYMQTCAIT